MTEKIKVLIVDDHQIIRDGLMNMLSSSNEIECIGSAKNGDEALFKLKSLLPDVLISDISMTGINGIELTSKIKEFYPEIKVLILTMYTNEDFVVNAIRAGAKGVLPKQNTNTQTLIDAVKTIAEGKEYYDSEISKILVKTLIDHGKSSDTSDLSNVYKLTARETEIIKLFANGMSNNQIAKTLNISVRTVETHKNNIMQKFNFKSTVEMVKFAIRYNIVSI